MNNSAVSRFPMTRGSPPSATIVTRQQPQQNTRVTFGSTPTHLGSRTAPLASLPPSRRQLSSSPQYIGGTPNGPMQHIGGTPSPTHGVQIVQRGLTPTPPSYTKFHDENGMTTPSTKAKKKNKNQRRHARKKAGWEKLLCIEEMQDLARRGPKMPDFGKMADAWGRRGMISRDRGAYRPRNQYEFRDGTRLVSIDSTEDNWDLPPDYPDNLLPARAGPHQNRDADDFGITTRDLFPWFANLIESCCCAEKKPQRALVRSRGAAPARGPQLETVCLDCGNVLEHHAMPQGLSRNVLGERYDWSHLGGGMPGAMEGGDDTHKLPKYDGYKTWQVGGGCDHLNTTSRGGRARRVPLPAFQPGPTRVFNNVPSIAVTQRGLDIVDSDYHNIDDAGRVVLPNFPETTAATARV